MAGVEKDPLFYAALRIKAGKGVQEVQGANEGKHSLSLMAPIEHGWKCMHRLTSVCSLNFLNSLPVLRGASQKRHQKKRQAEACRDVLQGKGGQPSW